MAPVFSVHVFDRSFNPAQNPFALTVGPYASSALGGYDTAEITV